MDGGESSNGGAVEHEAVFEGVGDENCCGDCEVLLNSGHIAETNVDEFDLLLIDEFCDFGRTREHVSSFLTPERERVSLSSKGMAKRQPRKW